MYSRRILGIVILVAAVGVAAYMWLHPTAAHHPSAVEPSLHSKSNGDQGTPSGQPMPAAQPEWHSARTGAPTADDKRSILEFLTSRTQTRIAPEELELFHRIARSSPQEAVELADVVINQMQEAEIQAILLRELALLRAPTGKLIDYAKRKQQSPNFDERQSAVSLLSALATFPENRQAQEELLGAIGRETVPAVYRSSLAELHAVDLPPGLRGTAATVLQEKLAIAGSSEESALLNAALLRFAPTQDRFVSAANQLALVPNAEASAALMRAIHDARVDGATAALIQPALLKVLSSNAHSDDVKFAAAHYLASTTTDERIFMISTEVLRARRE